MKKSDQSAVYGLKYPSRALCAVQAETERTKFLVASLSLKHENEVHLLDFDDDTFEVNSIIFRHPAGEVWSLASCPARPDLFFTTYSVVGESTEMKGSLWQIKEESPEKNKGLPLQQIVTLPDHSEKLQAIFWEPNDKVGRVISLDESNIRIWNLDSKFSIKAGDSIQVPPGDKKGTAKLRTMAWNPHTSNQIATANDCLIRGWDLRSLRQTFTIDQAHGLCVRDIDFNPNKPHQLASCGDDCKIKFWDIRHTDKPIRIINSHSHWVWRVTYNRFHDQLVLSSSSDSVVNLENIISISSVTSLSSETEEHKESSEKQMDGLVTSYDQHEDSVYSIAWSAADPWVFASVSYDGRVVINAVPREEKYKIIL